MVDILIDSLTDTLKMLPFLVIAFVFLEWIETKISEKTEHAIEKAGKAGPAAGALLGLIPQCGFSVIGANFFSKKIITLGTLIAIFLSTSDEAFLVLLSNAKNTDAILDLLTVMGIKLFMALAAGFLTDLIIKPKKEHHEEHHHEDHGDEHDHDRCCHHHDWKDIAICTAKRTAETWIFIFIANVLLGAAIHWLGEDKIYSFMLTDSVFQPLLAALIGMIPNCAPSVILAQMYVDGAISLGSVIAGLGTGAGVGLLMLFRVNKDIKQNLKIASLLYICGAFFGVVIQIITKFI